MLGLEKGKVKLTPYDKDWPQLFDQECQRIKKAGGTAILELHHIGSTAVPDMPAKPVVDLLALVPSLDRARDLAPILAVAGYTYEADMDEPDKLFFKKGNPTTFHLHFVEKDSPRCKGYLVFRDAMRNDQKLAREYISLKQSLAKKYANNRKAYTKAKASFIKEVLKKT